jgi:antibiotic biosynthesis monooxygenase (ABM) superfamily enzyme
VTDQRLNESPVLRRDGADVMVITARNVEPGYEEAFQQWAQGILEAAGSSSGHLGGGLFRPALDGRPWIVVHRFRDQTALDTWLTSPVRASFLDHTKGHHHTEVARRELSGMEAWFTGLDPNAAAPPRWKMVVVAGLGSYPISLIGNGLLGPALVGLPLPVRAAVFAALFSTLMTVVMMPVLSRLLRSWLRPVRRTAPRSVFRRGSAPP